MYMSVNKIFSVLLIASLMACNNTSTETADHMTDSKHHEDHQIMEGSTGITPVPEIPENASVFFVNLKDGQTVSPNFLVVMGVENMSVDTANGIIKAGSGHHHIFIDQAEAFPHGEVVPKDSVHIHFGNAQKEAELTLAPGKHTLRLQFADALHRSYGDKLSASISVIVKK
jgi:hypothetical protein